MLPFLKKSFHSSYQCLIFFYAYTIVSYAINLDLISERSNSSQILIIFHQIVMRLQIVWITKFFKKINQYTVKLLTKILKCTKKVNIFLYINQNIENILWQTVKRWLVTDGSRVKEIVRLIVTRVLIASTCPNQAFIPA